MSSAAPHQAERHFRAGAIWATVYSKETTRNGRGFTEHSIRIQRHWKDERTGKWASTTYFRPDDLPKLILVTSKAYEFVTLREPGPCPSADGAGTSPEADRTSERSKTEP